METSESEIDRFTMFARAKLRDDSSLSLEAIFNAWRSDNVNSDDLLAIEASIRDMERGERGREFSDFAAQFRALNGLPPVE